MPDICARLTSAMTGAVSICLENMAFMSVDLLPADDDRPAAARCSSATLLVHDPVPDEIRLEMPAEVLSEIACSIYSVSADELSAQQRLDILAEMLNTIVGLFLTDLLPSDQDFRIGLPEVEEDAGTIIEPPQDSWKFKTDYGVFTITHTGKGWDAAAE